MQRLSNATISSHQGERLAKLVLDGVPSVMWFVRAQMRENRTADLSVPQFRTLILLQRWPHASISHIAEHLGASLPSASRLVTGLVQRKLIRRKASKSDRRQTPLELTATGRVVLRRAQRATLRSLAQKLQGLTEQERSNLASAMTLVARVFDPAPPATAEKGKGA